MKNSSSVHATHQRNLFSVDPSPVPSLPSKNSSRSGAGDPPMLMHSLSGSCPGMMHGRVHLPRHPRGQPLVHEGFDDHGPGLGRRSDLRAMDCQCCEKVLELFLFLHSQVLFFNDLLAFLAGGSHYRSSALLATISLIISSVFLKNPSVVQRIAAACYSRARVLEGWREQWCAGDKKKKKATKIRIRKWEPDEPFLSP